MPLPPRRPIFQVVASADPQPAGLPPSSAPVSAPIKIASLSPNDIVKARGLWETLGATASTPRALDGAHDMTASIGPFGGPDRVPPDLALAYAAQAENALRTPALRPSAQITTTGSGSIARKPSDSVANHRTQTTDRLDDPWLRGLMLTDSVQGSLVVTPVGDPNLKGLVDYMRKPAAAVVMTFSGNPHLGMTEDKFSGSAVVFLSTVTFSAGRTAALR